MRILEDCCYCANQFPYVSATGFAYHYAVRSGTQSGANQIISCNGRRPTFGFWTCDCADYALRIRFGLGRRDDSHWTNHFFRRNCANSRRNSATTNTSRMISLGFKGLFLPYWFSKHLSYHIPLPVRYPEPIGARPLCAQRFSALIREKPLEKME